MDLFEDEKYLVCYGDSLGNVNIDKLDRFHVQSKKAITMTAVHPPASFGEIFFGDNGELLSFEEKPQLNRGWINGGYFMLNRSFLDYLDDTNVMLERDPLQKAIANNAMGSYKHEDSSNVVIRELRLIEISKTSLPWLE